MVKLLTAIKFHDIIGMLDTHLNQEEVDLMVKNNKQTFQEFYDPILIRCWYKTPIRQNAY